MAELRRLKLNSQQIVHTNKGWEMGKIIKSHPTDIPSYDVLLESGKMLLGLPTAKSLAKFGTFYIRKK